ncbi:unnamed protein product, partial [Gongylonema pulchrum]|uniref:Sulfate_transp domain-containing protein n=1 Tax=Gongylonema pulchrum TaxID=637853 RepID=A0A183E5P9_9BILA
QAIDIARKIPEANTVALTSSIIGFFFLYIGKDYINPTFQKFLPAPFPFELLLVCAATAASSHLELEKLYGLQVIGEIPVGFDKIDLPRVELFPYMYEDAVVIAIVVMAVHLSLCKMFSRRHQYKVDNNQVYKFAVVDDEEIIQCVFLLGSTLYDTIPSKIKDTSLKITCVLPQAMTDSVVALRKFNSAHSYFIFGTTASHITNGRLHFLPLRRASNAGRLAKMLSFNLMWLQPPLLPPAVLSGAENAVRGTNRGESQVPPFVPV